jgi:hypothetical protein
MNTTSYLNLRTMALSCAALLPVNAQAGQKPSINYAEAAALFNSGETFTRVRENDRKTQAVMLHAMEILYYHHEAQVQPVRRNLALEVTPADFANPTNRKIISGVFTQLAANPNYQYPKLPIAQRGRATVRPSVTQPIGANLSMAAESVTVAKQPFIKRQLPAKQKAKPEWLTNPIFNMDGKLPQ